MDKAQQGRPPGKADFGNNPPNRFKLSPADRNWAEEAGSKPFPKLDFEPYKPMTPQSPMPNKLPMPKPPMPNKLPMPKPTMPK